MRLCLIAKSGMCLPKFHLLCVCLVNSLIAGLLMYSIWVCLELRVLMLLTIGLWSAQVDAQVICKCLCLCVSVQGFEVMWQTLWRPYWRSTALGKLAMNNWLFCISEQNLKKTTNFCAVLTGNVILPLINLTDFVLIMGLRLGDISILYEHCGMRLDIKRDFDKL